MDERVPFKVEDWGGGGKKITKKNNVAKAKTNSRKMNTEKLSIRKLKDVQN